MNIFHILEKKRAGQPHTAEEIQFLVQGMMDGTVADYQTSAWLMASCIHGLSLDEAAWLTEAFVHSGDNLDFSHVDGIVVDKHSTGGVGDNTTLILVPLLAASGVKVGKLSGRGLGFTGGTIDKLEAIPDINVHLSSDAFTEQLNTIGAVVSSSSINLAPADAKMYALRDVTSTVDSIPLIAASVVSKKIASGANVIVLDIKVGRGAFMKTMEEAQQLADMCRTIGQRLGRNLSTVISSMDQPLGMAVGHTTEVEEAISTLKGKGPKDLEELCLTLGGVTLVSAGKADSLDAAKALLKEKLEDGSAYEKLVDMVQAQGGDIDSLSDPTSLPQPARISFLPATAPGYVKSIDSLKVAEAVKMMGAGRYRKDDTLDLGVGVVFHKKVGDAVEEGETLMEVYAGTKNQQEARDMLMDAFTFQSAPLETLPPLILDASIAQPLSV